METEKVVIASTDVVDEKHFTEVKVRDRNIAQMNYSIDINSINVYQFMSEACDGTGGFRSGSYLVKFSRETEFKSRMQIAFYKNYLKQVLRAMVEPVFAQVVAREYEQNALFDQFIKDVDVCGTSIQDFVHTSTTIARKHGVVFIVMDNFNADVLPVTLAEAQMTRKFPYIYTKTADQVEKSLCKTDQFGNIEYITFFDSIEILTNGTKNMYYRMWTKEESILLKKEENSEKFLEVSKTVHGLGIVPVIAIFAEQQEDKSCLLPNPPLYDIARVNWHIFNMATEKRHQERCQAFSVFYAQGVPSQDLVISENNYINLPVGVTIAPGYATPPSATLDYLMRSEEQIRKELLLLCEQAGVIGIQTQESGISKSYDFEAKENVLKRTSVIAATTEEKVSNLFKLYTNEKFVYSVAYPVDFAPMGLDREIDRIDKVLKMPGLNEMFLKKIQERLAKLYFADDNKEVLDEILEAIRDHKTGASDDVVEQPIELDREIDRIDKIIKIPGLNPVFANKLQEKLARLMMTEDDNVVMTEIVDDINRQVSDGSATTMQSDDDKINNIIKILTVGGVSTISSDFARKLQTKLASIILGESLTFDAPIIAPS